MRNFTAALAMASIFGVGLLAPAEPSTIRLELSAGSAVAMPLVSHGYNVRWSTGSYPESNGKTLSGNGRFAVFASMANNIVRGKQMRRTWELYLHDNRTGRNRRVTTSPAGAPGNGHSDSATISTNGRFISYASRATNLVGQRSRAGLMYVFDRQTGKSSYAVRNLDGNPVAAYGGFAMQLSDNGRYGVFLSASDNIARGYTPSEQYQGGTKVFVADRATGSVEMISRTGAGTSPNGQSNSVSISGDGGTVAFVSSATDLPGADGDELPDVYVWTRAGGLRRAPLPRLEPWGGTLLSRDGRFLAITASDPRSAAPTKPRVYRLDLVTHDLKRLNSRKDLVATGMTADGSAVMFSQINTYASVRGGLYLPGSGAARQVPLPARRRSGLTSRQTEPSAISANGRVVLVHDSGHKGSTYFSDVYRWRR
ncbi:MAG TPA: hypothetical protein VK204_14815 [Nocardioidaceae bacterium]|nr:hypothetical protein [Nocardioidaceae bacterium]